MHEHAAVSPTNFGAVLGRIKLVLPCVRYRVHDCTCTRGSAADFFVQICIWWDAARGALLMGVKHTIQS
jgi:hypothetical protein